MHNNINVLNSESQLSIDKQSLIDNLGRRGPSMSTVEIADLTGKRHDHVMRDAKLMLSDLHGVNSLPKFGGSYVAGNGQAYSCFRLPKKQVLCLVAGYSVRLRMKIIDRLEELEAKDRDPMVVLNDPGTLRIALLQYSEKVIALQNTVKAQAPKAAALDRIATAEGSMPVSTAAKHLQTGPKKLFKYLSEYGWIYRRAGGKNWLGYQRRVQQGLLEHKVTTMSYGDGTERIFEQVRITPKGLARLSEIFERAEV